MDIGLAHFMVLKHKYTVARLLFILALHCTFLLNANIYLKCKCSAVGNIFCMQLNIIPST